MTSLRMTSHCMTSRCSVLFLLGLFEKDCSIIMLNFNKLRSIVYEIFDNSQLFLTDPRIRHSSRNAVSKLAYLFSLCIITACCHEIFIYIQQLFLVSLTLSRIYDTFEYFIDMIILVSYLCHNKKHCTVCLL